MSIHKKRGKYYAAVYSGVVNGKEVYEWSEAFDAKKDAELKELELKKEVIERNHKVKPKESLGLIADAWLKMKSKTVTAVTLKGYEDCYNSYIKQAFELTKVKNIETIDVSNFMFDLEYKPSTIKKIMTTLKQILDYAITLEYIRYNPCIGVKKPNVRFTKKNTWDADTISNFLALEIVKSSPIYTALLILFKTGMRPGEVCGIRWCDFDGESFSPEIGVAKNGENTDLKNTKAHDSIYLTDDLIAYLKNLRKQHKELYLSEGKAFKVDGYINCLLPDFRPVTPNYLTHKFKKLVIKAGFELIRLYDARHSFGTNMMKSGVNPKMVADMMRHTDVRTTLNNYSHTDKEMYKNTVSMYKIQIK